jgi:hypothetical protein
LAIPLQTIKILGTLALGEDHAFERHALSFLHKGRRRASPAVCAEEWCWYAFPTVFFVTTSLHCRLNV